MLSVSGGSIDAQQDLALRLSCFRLLPLSPKGPESLRPERLSRALHLRFYRVPVRILAFSIPALLLALIALRACAPLASDASAGRQPEALAPVAPVAPLAPVIPGAEAPAREVPGPPSAEPETSRAPPPTPLRIPVEGVELSQLRDHFDDRRGGGRAHEAIDILAPRGTPVLAVADGTVAKLWQSVPGGITLYQFDSSGSYCYYYAHLERYARGITEGQSLRRGQVLGYVGTSGNAPRDTPHLHFAIYRLTPERRWWEGEPLNPFPLLGGASASVPD